MAKETKVMGQAEIQKRLTEYRTKVSGMTFDKLVLEEKSVVEEIDKHNAYVSQCKINLPAKNKVDAMVAIQELLERQKVQWGFAIVMAKIFKTFDPHNAPKEVEFTILDTMLRTLSSQEYTGSEDWLKCDFINSYFEPIRDEYVSISEKTYELAEKHVIIDETLRLFSERKADKAETKVGN